MAKVEIGWRRRFRQTDLNLIKWCRATNSISLLNFEAKLFKLCNFNYSLLFVQFWSLIAKIVYKLRQNAKNKGDTHCVPKNWVDIRVRLT